MAATIPEFFCPYSSSFQKAIEDFHGLDQQEWSTLKKVAVIGLSILGGLLTFSILGLGALPAFCWAVTLFKEDSSKEDSSEDNQDHNPVYVPINLSSEQKIEKWKAKKVFYENRQAELARIHAERKANGERVGYTLQENNVERKIRELDKRLRNPVEYIHQ